jgi:hypothetical protein
MAAIFEVVQPYNSLTLEHFIFVEGDVPDWVKHCAKPFAGPIPKGRPVFPVNTLAAASEVWAPAKPKPALRLQELKRRYGWTRDEQATEAIGRIGFPNGKIVTVEELVHKGGMQISRHQQWTAEELDNYDESLRRVFPNALGKR